MNRATLAFASFAVLAVSACGGNGGPDSCVPGTSIACSCTNGASGGQICSADGTFAACACTDGSTSGPYRLGVGVIRTGWSGSAVTSTSVAESACPPLYVAQGLFGNVRQDTINTSNWALSRTGLSCVQLKSSGPANIVTNSTTLGSATSGTPASSACLAGQVMMGVGYENANGSWTNGLAANCVAFAQWVEPASSPTPSLADVLGHSPVSAQLNCPQGYALTSLEGSQYDSSLGSLRAVCTQILRSDQ